jgi:hypothetical protein
MKSILVALVCSAVLGSAGVVRAEDAAAKPDCTEKQKAVDDAKAAEMALPKADLSSCADKKGTEKSECEKPLKEKYKADKKEAADKVKEAKDALACCKNPKKKGCTAPAAPATP